VFVGDFAGSKYLRNSGSDVARDFEASGLRYLIVSSIVRKRLKPLAVVLPMVRHPSTEHPTST
jgi:hypothetical protein